MLSPFERQLRVAHSKEVLELFQNPEEDFLRRIVTGDEVWLCHYDLSLSNRADSGSTSILRGRSGSVGTPIGKDLGDDFLRCRRYTFD
ncbi:hypothetical protein M514_08470 [Trichuris suis]|uniref:Uncharacterized protein n=1 Tax=Trichuris suis TaxID=68888 RepID=A0A085MWH8_9BILA|nr:hypothetical protein M514_08470 [Trichuris suis]